MLGIWQHLLLTSKRFCDYFLAMYSVDGRVRRQGIGKAMIALIMNISALTVLKLPTLLKVYLAPEGLPVAVVTRCILANTSNSIIVLKV